MFITYNESGKVVGYSDKERNIHDLVVGESQVEIDYEFGQIGCKEGGLTFENGKLLNAGEVIGEEVKN